jgi:hypothetical protein
MTVPTYTGMKRVYGLSQHVPLECGFCADGINCCVKGGGTTTSCVFDWSRVPTTWSVKIVTCRLGNNIFPMDDHDLMCMFYIYANLDKIHVKHAFPTHASTLLQYIEMPSCHGGGPTLGLCIHMREPLFDGGDIYLPSLNVFHPISSQVSIGLVVFSNTLSLYISFRLA